MVNGPPCRQCGNPLRWVAEQGSWACDRCRQMFPATPQPQAPMPQAPMPMMQPPMQMQPPVQMQPAHMQPQQPVMQPPPLLQGPSPMMGPPPVAAPALLPVPPKRSKKTLIVALIAVVVVAGATTGIVLATRGGNGGGAGSRDELAGDLVAAITAGDVDALQKLADPMVVAEREADCPADTGAKVDPAPAQKAARERIQKLVDEHKPQQLVAGALDEVQSSATKVAKGSDLDGRCKAKTEFTNHTVAFHLTGQVNGKPRALIARLAIAEIDGRWFLAQLPDIKPTGTCKTGYAGMAAATKDTLEAMNVDLDKVRALVLAHCKSDAWTEEMLGCLVDAKVDKDVEKCMGQRTAAQVAAFDPPMTDLVNASKPVEVTGIAPNVGELAGGTQVTIKGTNFLPDKSSPRKVTVTIDGKPADVIRIASDTELVVKTPEGANAGAVDVVVQFDGVPMHKLTGAFTYGDAAPSATPADE